MVTRGIEGNRGGVESEGSIEGRGDVEIEIDGGSKVIHGNSVRRPAGTSQPPSALLYGGGDGCGVEHAPVARGAVLADVRLVLVQDVGTCGASQRSRACVRRESV
jgi:hypothetical protein